MAKEFKKGDRVALISNWNRKGCMRIRRCTVYSAGAKQMVLTDNRDGSEAGRHFLPTREQYSRSLVVHDAAGWDELVAIAREQSKVIKAAEIAQFEKIISLENDSSRVEYFTGKIADVNNNVDTFEEWPLGFNS